MFEFSTALTSFFLPLPGSLVNYCKINYCLYISTCNQFISTVDNSKTTTQMYPIASVEYGNENLLCSRRSKIILNYVIILNNKNRV